MAPKNYFAGIFGRSPVRPLQQHMNVVTDCAEQLVPFLKALQNNDWTAAEKARHEVTRLEDEADAMKKEIRMNMPKSLFMPVARADLLDLLLTQDKIANRTKDITGLMTGRKMRAPNDGIADALVEFATRCVDATEQAKKTVNELDELFETGFRGAEVEMVAGMIEELDRIEKDTDRMQVEIRARIFEIEKNLPPVDVMFLYRIIDWIGDLGDLSQRVGSRLQLLLAH